MTISKKKVVLLLVEGSCEEVLLYNRLRGLFEQHNIRFHIQHGDILYDLDRPEEPIKSVIESSVNEFMIKSKFRPEDVFCVLHIIDMDGCFIPDDAIVIDDTQKELTIYHEDRITVPHEKQKLQIAARNADRSNNINIMKVLGTILSVDINYRMFYFSRNLEHVLFKEPNPEKDRKFPEVERFIEQLEMPIEEFLQQSMPVLKGLDPYSESWERITESTSSLQQYCNVPLLFDFVKFQSGQSPKW
ncbi:hypothetical protein [Sporosarcina sp. JAI121]|uniref:hypothetical protein n=1 Tax=Sporosarcina sp. JAI121 TaxID=2723064 RepID=UPI0015C74D61|nr:hypothetical protein [Sporosarcina sp. JAI121]NYF24827.1 hypothetical protein [Sporosarcina sp. JAI121]